MALQKTKKPDDSKEKERLAKIDQSTRKTRSERKFMKEMLDHAEEVEWDELPDVEIPFLAVEIIGTEGTGKTHSALTFPEPALMDTEGKGCNVMKKFDNPRWFKGNTFLDVIDFVNTVIRDDNIKTAIFDSSRDIVDMSETFTMEQLEKTGLYSTAGAVLYTHVNQKMDWIVQILRANGKNIVFTSRMKDEYKNNSRTGGYVRDGYKKAPYQFDLVLELTTEIEWAGEKHILIEPVVKVIKNGYVRRGTTKPYIMNADYDTILKEIFTPVDRDEYMDSFLNSLGKSQGD